MICSQLWLRRYLYVSVLAVTYARGQQQSDQTLEGKLRQLEQEYQQSAAKLEDLDQSIRILARKIELDQEAVAARALETPVVRADRDGFWLRSANSDFQLRIGGYVHADSRSYLEDVSGLGTSTFVLRRVRPMLQGTIYKFIQFRLLPDFGDGKAVLQDAYVEFRYFPKAALRAGKFKTPFGLERLISATDLPFIERGLPTAIAPNRDLGLQLSGDLTKGRINYAAGVFNGVVDGGSADGDSNDAKDYVIRLFARPFAPSRNGHPLKGLGAGLAASTGKQSGALPTFKSAGQLTFFTYAGDVTASGARTRLSPQAYYYRGPFGLLAEFIESTQRVRRAGNSILARNQAWQTTATYMLTGEAKSYGSTAPVRNFEPGKGGWGAWELVGRAGQLRVDPKIFARALADPQKSARVAREWGVGVNWYLNQSVKISLDYLETGFTGGSVGRDRSRERAVLNRFQIVL